MLIAGEIEFYVLMGGILGPLVPAMEIQGLPFAFQDHAQVHATLDGPLGDHLRKELAAKGIHALPHRLMENGFRLIFPPSTGRCTPRQISKGCASASPKAACLPMPLRAMIIALVGCYQGFQIRGGVDDVGPHTTISVVQSIFLVIVFDSICSILTNWWDL